ncbi:MAG: type II toxin-antitoxin system PemK/MazF family toxin [Bacteroidales bacterium]|jgi:mRNA-degrading endonuclease toxin of MazEF toxin-antitoxin module|nr:type II toxin-antitoxin system PemK/MazF family toxin [Bacteroidales bacterium]
MRYCKGDVVNVVFLLPDGQTKEHPAIIVSNDDLQEKEGFLYLVMISSKNVSSEYGFELTDEMLTKPMSKKSFVKCQIIAGYTEKDIIGRHGKIKIPYLKQIIEKIIVSIF